MGWQVLSIINIFRCRSNKHPKRTQTHNCKGDGAVKSTSVSFAVSDGSIQPWWSTEKIGNLSKLLWKVAPPLRCVPTRKSSSWSCSKSRRSARRTWRKALPIHPEQNSTCSKHSNNTRSPPTHHKKFVTSCAKNQSPGPPSPLRKKIRPLSGSILTDRSRYSKSSACANKSLSLPPSCTAYPRQQAQHRFLRSRRGIHRSHRPSRPPPLKRGRWGDLQQAQEVLLALRGRVGPG